MGTFYPFEDDTEVKLYGVEAAGEGIESGKHSATLAAGSEGIFHGMYTYVLQDKNGQIAETHSVSAGLDYPGVGPEHSFLKTIKRAEYVYANDKEAVDAFLILCKEEGIIPALESSHALAHAIKLAPKMQKSQSIVVTLSDEATKTWKQSPNTQVQKYEHHKIGLSKSRNSWETAASSATSPQATPHPSGHQKSLTHSSEAA